MKEQNLIHTVARILYQAIGVSLGSAFLFITTECTGQTDAPNTFDFEYQRFSFRDFDLSVRQNSIKDRLFCEDWCRDTIITMVDTMAVKFNFDYEESLYYLNMNEKVFAIKSDFIKSFIIDQSTYINYKLPQSDKPLILERIVNGNYVLYKAHNRIYRKPDFDPILNVGSKEGMYKKRYGNYAYCSDHLFEISGKTKKAAKKLQQECGLPKSFKPKGTLEDFFVGINRVDSENTDN